VHLARWRPLAAALSCLALVALASLSEAGTQAPARKVAPFRVDGTPMRSITLTDFRQFAALSIPDLQRIKNDGFNTVTVYVYRSVDDVYDNTQASGPFTEPDASLGAVFDAAHDVGLGVQLIPTIWVGRTKFVWRAHMQPTDVGAFFDSYREMVNHYAELAQQHQVELFGVGSEMVDLEGYTNQWRQTVGEARQHYSGRITYFTVTWSALKVRWWSAVDYPSISVYYSLSPQARPSYDEITSAWRRVYVPQLRRMSRSIGRPLMVSEIGYRSLPGAATHPELNGSGLPDESLQRDLYRAFLEVPLKDWSVDGVAFFRWSAYELGPLNGGYSPKGKAAECALALAWAPRGTAAESCRSVGRVVG
jgi:hypothetical protein